MLAYFYVTSTQEEFSSVEHDMGDFQRVYRCTVCSAEYQQLASLRRHQENAHGKLRYICRACKLNWRRIESARRHMAMSADQLCAEAGFYHGTVGETPPRQEPGGAQGSNTAEPRPAGSQSGHRSAYQDDHVQQVVPATSSMDKRQAKECAEKSTSQKRKRKHHKDRVRE